MWRYLKYVYGKSVVVYLTTVHPGVDSTNMFPLSFYACRSQESKKDSLIVFFALLGYECVKTAFKMLVKSAPGGLRDTQRQSFTYIK
jgi:hypothetical protein